MFLVTAKTEKLPPKKKLCAAAGINLLLAIETRCTPNIKAFGLMLL
jgi:hypothetical protein